MSQGERLPIPLSEITCKLQVMINKRNRPRSKCPIACSLDILGDKWTMLVLRDLMQGHTLFGEFERAPEGISSNILAERLQRLENSGLIERTRGNRRRFTYRLTPKGRDLRPVLLELVEWGNSHISGTVAPQDEYLTRG